MDETASDAKSWRERWTLQKELPSGNQGIAMKATDASGQAAFLKVLGDEDQSNSERRGRMHREVLALRTVDVPEIPRLIETNAMWHYDLAYKLYLATEYIEGPTLQRFVQERKISPDLALAFALSLCKTLTVAHERGIFHRDIKPDNIIVSSRNNDLVPMLVDFGMSSIENLSDDIHTTVGQEVGNRFLRLSEFRAGSESKADLRSDVTLCVGLFFYMLTNCYPRWLRDERGQLPHQRENIPEILDRLPFNSERLRRLFEKGLNDNIALRFQSIEEFTRSLGRLLRRPSDHGSYDESVAERVLERIGTSAEHAKIENMSAMERIVRRTGAIVNGIARKFLNQLVMSQRDYNSTPHSVSTHYCLAVTADQTTAFDTLVTTTIAGTDILLILDGPGVPRSRLRVAIDHELTIDHEKVIEAFYMAGVDCVTDPEKRANIATTRNTVLVAARRAATMAIDSMTASVTVYIEDESSGIALADNSPRYYGEPKDTRTNVTSQSMILGRLKIDGRYVRFNCIVNIRLSNHLDDIDEMQNYHTVMVTVMENETGGGPQAQIAQSGDSLAPFAPSKGRLRELLDRALGMPS